METPTWPVSGGFVPPAVYLYLAWNPRGTGEGWGDKESAQGDDGQGGSGSRKAVTSGAFPGNRASVPCNADSGPEGQMEHSIAPKELGRK